MSIRRLDPSAVAAHFAEKGCTLLDECTTSTAPVRYVCACGREATTSWNRFQSGRVRCAGCPLNRADKLATARQQFEAAGCRLDATEYVNTTTPMPWACSCGNQSPQPITLAVFRCGHRCAACGRAKAVANIQKAAGRRRHSIGHVRRVFSRHGCRLLSEEYQNAHGTLSFVCSCGRTAETTLSDFQQTPRCPGCPNRLKGGKSLDIEDVRRTFAEAGCRLLEDVFPGTSTPVRWACSCGNATPRPIAYSNFVRGARCQSCAVLKRKQTRAAAGG
mgnify:CR=1 FL=1